jgi:hypothetical protein
LVNEQPLGFLLTDYCQETPAPATLDGSNVYSLIQPNKAKIMEITNGAVDVP